MWTVRGGDEATRRTYKAESVPEKRNQLQTRK